MQTVIFDLDGTVFDSSHRQLTLEDGSLDLAHWRANSTHDKIMRDNPLPLARFWRFCLAEGHRVLICTARVMSASDYALLRKHKLYAHRIFSRKVGDNTADYLLKLEQISTFMAEVNINSALMFDDNPHVRKALSAIGVDTVDPNEYNASNL